MSHQLINLSPDLKQLRDEGYNIEIQSNYLLVKDVPFVNHIRQIVRGILVSELTMSGEVTAPPNTHVVGFAGGTPCDSNGATLDSLINEPASETIAEGITLTHRFSRKPFPSGAYLNYYDKMSTYVNLLLSHVHRIDPNVTAKTWPTITASEEESVFKYLDTASSRAGIGIVSTKLELEKVAIIGIGGTGSYILDLIAKTPVKELHIFDGDEFLNHNAFRAPGAASVEELQEKPKKVGYFENIYSKMRRGIVAHDYYLNSTNINELRGFDFVFLCIDANDSKPIIVEGLESFNIPFIDTGLGVQMVDEALRGSLRVTTNTPTKREHFRQRVPMLELGINNEYSRNIQVADLNALTATLAVIKWKKWCGFYLDFEQEYHTTYHIDSSALINDEH